MTVRRQEWMTDQVYAWACLEREARLNTLARRNTNKDVLVAIKAQHPLHEDGTPGPEYELRLEKALEVGARLESKGWKVTYMTFGGIHEGNKYVTLADAGAAWLKSHGVVSVITCPVVFSGNDEDRMAEWLLTVACDFIGWPVGQNPPLLHIHGMAAGNAPRHLSG